MRPFSVPVEFSCRFVAAERSGTRKIIPTDHGLPQLTIPVKKFCWQKSNLNLAEVRTYQSRSEVPSNLGDIAGRGAGGSLPPSLATDVCRGTGAMEGVVTAPACDFIRGRTLKGQADADGQDADVALHPLFQIRRPVWASRTSRFSVRSGDGTRRFGPLVPVRRTTRGSVAGAPTGAAG